MQRRALISSRSNGSNNTKGASATKLQRSRSGFQNGHIKIRSFLILTPLMSLICLWLYATIYILSSNDINTSISLRSLRNRTKHTNRLVDVLRGSQNNDAPKVNETKPKSILISRNANVTITSSARGNLGPPSVLNQDPPGTDWLKDRWQAASDMHGSAIPGSHWVILDISRMLSSTNEEVYLTKIVLDWETAFASDYRIETRIDPPTSPGGINDNWCVLYDGGKGNQPKHETNTRYPLVTNDEYGQSPGVKEKLPLHIIHTIDWSGNSTDSDEFDERCHHTKYARIFIRKSARGWGVSLWQVDIYGFVTTAMQNIS